MATNPAFRIGYEIKQMFIRDKQMASKFERSQNAALRRFGSIVRRDARKSIKKGRPRDLVAIHLVTKNLLYGAAASSSIQAGTARLHRKPSDSGPPKMWTTSEPNLRTILYGIEKAFLDLIVVIGPVALGSTRPTVPETLEHGVGTYRKRSFMGPALERKRDQLLESLLKFGVV